MSGPTKGASAPPTHAVARHHLALTDGPFWLRIPGYCNVTEAQFLDHHWQQRNTITSPERMLKVLGESTTAALIDDMRLGLSRSPMSFRITPYLISLIDWANPLDDPLFLQFVPSASRVEPDHPELEVDALEERQHMPVPGLTHRYPDKVLFLSRHTCPIYCRFCTRSYAVGPDAGSLVKDRPMTKAHWKRAFEYVRAHTIIEDVVISGGDAYHLKASQIEELANAFLEIPSVMRLRFASRGPAAMPQKILTDHAWTDALTRAADTARRMHKHLALHTHFNHPNEVTSITLKAMRRLSERGLVIRNQSVLLRGVNDSAAVIGTLVRRLGYLNINPYYVYVHDLVPGVEDLRTSVATAIEIEKHIRGSTAGFNTPTFVVDTRGGGGKRDVHSYEYYHRTYGIAVYGSPALHPGRLYLHFDPLRSLSEDVRAHWDVAKERERMTREVIELAREAALPGGSLR